MAGRRSNSQKEMLHNVPFQRYACTRKAPKPVGTFRFAAHVYPAANANIEPE
jgi:hypothetical protein